MKEILFSEFLKRLAKEFPVAYLTWYSISEAKKTDVIVAESRLEDGKLHFLNHRAHNHYGKVRFIQDLPFQHEWVDAIYLSRSLRSPSQLTVRTYI